MINKRILILGSSGMIGSNLFKILFNDGYHVYGQINRNQIKNYFDKKYLKNIVINKNIFGFNELENMIQKLKPYYIINCVGITKHNKNINNDLDVLMCNSILPHQLAARCKKFNFRLINISTDCVFSGVNGNYTEKSMPDANDLYGKSKYLGEVLENKNVLNIRTSIIAREMFKKENLLEWFLIQKKSIKGYKNAFFSGLTAHELVSILQKYFFVNFKYGLFHVGGNIISKYNLLKIISNIYEKKIDIIPDYKIKIDRSLNSKKFYSITGYKSKSWETLISQMQRNDLK